ncbi:phosphatidylethanolamine/phosphatidyl-N-methylethanolamine N-methyltransferase [Halpernia humi]|uniref:Phosphatidylethanolamine/phosphatidyl-N-methylethanolamine N-methyltransferase n=1 Tax=Halpernia humi TaxID=493375 RepID=A0A1H5X2T8_9FLAO|nr:methyltransferase domain-containing protein [Halpernia humi]SEG05536.1 phosphatidylethanolamine/phosphatidyl-N-methylethanolamine N-methyltransferase [Halpernia humi]
MATKMDGTEEAQKKAITYYDKLSVIYDFISNWYYKKARKYAISELKINRENTVLNLPCGTGENLKYFQKFLQNSGNIIGIDLSSGMLAQARKKVEANNYKNVHLIIENATKIDQDWMKDFSNGNFPEKVDAVFCDLGLSGLPEWENIIDNMISILRPGGRIVILDWFIEDPGLKGAFVKWIGKGEVNRPIYQYLKTKVSDFKVVDSFNFGGVFVASGTKP